MPWCDVVRLVRFVTRASSVEMWTVDQSRVPSVCTHLRFPRLISDGLSCDLCGCSSTCDHCTSGGRSTATADTRLCDAECHLVV